MRHREKVKGERKKVGGWRPGSWELLKKEIENRKEEIVKTNYDSYRGLSIFSFLITLFCFSFESLNHAKRSNPEPRTQNLETLNL